MSKSKGNVLDPLEIIADYGADAMRMALAGSVTDANIIELDRRRFEEFRHFINKLWNGARFVIMNLSIPSICDCHTLDPLTLEDSYILSRLSKTTALVQTFLEQYAFDKASAALYHFFWDEFCALYIEIAKPLFATQPTKHAIGLVVLIDILKLLHPFAPYVTEELFSILRDRCSSLDITRITLKRVKDALLSLSQPFICCSSFPRPSYEQTSDEELFSRIQAVVTSLRAIRGEMKIPPSTAVDLYVLGEGSLSKEIQKHEHILRSLSKIRTVTYTKAALQHTLVSKAAVEGCELIVPLPDSMKEQEIQRLKKAIDRTQKTLEKLTQQYALAASNIKTPPEVLEKFKGSMEQHHKELSVVREQLLLLS